MTNPYLFILCHLSGDNIANIDVLITLVKDVITLTKTIFSIGECRLCITVDLAIYIIEFPYDFFSVSS